MAIALGALATAQVITPADLQRGMIPNSGGRFSAPTAYDFNDHKGFHPIFDGKSLHGWDGDPARWHVDGETIVGEMPEKPVLNNTYLIYRAEKPRNFDLKLEIKIDFGGSGIQYRSRTGLPWTAPIAGAPAPNLDWMATGPQADMWPMSRLISPAFIGQLYLENDPRGVIAWRGDVTQAGKDEHQRLVARIGDPTNLVGHVSGGGWNQYEIIARGGVMMHIINGQLMAIHIDDDPASVNNQAGFIGLELEIQPARIQFRNIWLKTLD